MLEFDEARDKFLRHGKRRGLSPASITAYKRYLDRFIAFLRQRKCEVVTHIRPRHLNLFASHMTNGGFSATTVSQTQALIAKWVRFLSHQGCVDSMLFPATSGRKRKWSKDRIISELKELQQQGVRITYPGLWGAGRSDLTSAACRYFGSLRKARAGVPK